MLRSGWAISPGREGAGRDLVQQRLEDVVVAAIDERQVDPGVAAEAPRGVQAPKSAADDGDAVPGRGLHALHDAGARSGGSRSRSRGGPSSADDARRPP